LAGQTGVLGGQFSQGGQCLLLARVDAVDHPDLGGKLGCQCRVQIEQTLE
jgi:hypothetical protein